jgi:chromosomal replication initiator protein
LLQSIWKLCAASLQDELPSQQFNTWIRPLQIDESTSPQELRLLAPNRFICDWVAEKFLTRIRELASHYHQDNNLRVAVGVAPRSVGGFQVSSANQRVAAGFESAASDGVSSLIEKAEETVVFGSQNSIRDGHSDSYSISSNGVKTVGKGVEDAKVRDIIVEAGGFDTPRATPELEVEGGLKHSNYLNELNLKTNLI